MRGLLADRVDLAGPHLIKFGIEGKFSAESTSVARFKHQIAQALRDMRRICEAQNGKSVEGGQVKAKL